MHQLTWPRAVPIGSGSAAVVITPDAPTVRPVRWRTARPLRSRRLGGGPGTSGRCCGEHPARPNAEKALDLSPPRPLPGKGVVTIGRSGS